MLGITIALASTGTISYPTASALVLGENIGTTITALLASVGANVSAKRAAYSHAIFNICGVIIMILIFHKYIAFIDMVVPGSPEMLDKSGAKPNISAHVAMVHTVFNLTATLIMLPFLGYLAQLVTWLIPSKTEVENSELKYISSTVATNTEVALNMVELEMKSMFELLEKLFQTTEQYLRSPTDQKNLIEEIYYQEEVSNKISQQIKNFCCKIVKGEVTNEQSCKTYALNGASSEIESIADSCKAIAKLRKSLFENDFDFSENAWDEIYNFFSSTNNFFSKVSKQTISMQCSKGVEHEELKEIAKVLDNKADLIRDNHLMRMRDGKCKPLPAMTFNDIASEMKEVKNHTHNLLKTINC